MFFLYVLQYLLLIHGMADSTVLVIYCKQTSKSTNKSQNLHSFIHRLKYF